MYLWPVGSDSTRSRNLVVSHGTRGLPCGDDLRRSEPISPITVLLLLYARLHRGQRRSALACHGKGGEQRVVDRDTVCCKGAIISPLVVVTSRFVLSSGAVPGYHHGVPPGWDWRLRPSGQQFYDGNAQ